ncbi:MAG: hypothetical protein WCF67_20085 [Chitinophagaceae bacterium]
MQLPAHIPFNYLLKIVKGLPVEKLEKLRSEINAETKISTSHSDLATLLLNGPVATKKQLAVIQNNRKAINQWRKTGLL